MFEIIDSVQQFVREVELFYSYMDSPVGGLLLAGTAKSLKVVGFSTGKKARGADPGWERWDEPFERVKKQLNEYFDGQRQQFELDLEADGTPFQRQVLEELQKIPYGETLSYRDVAQRIGNAKAVRAVGNANGSNPIPVIIPCHRVIGSDGSLTGFCGGLAVKRYLLDLESRHSGLFAG